MKRYLVVTRRQIKTPFFEGGFYGVFDTQNRAFVIHESGGFTYVEEDANREAEALNAAWDDERFEEFLRVGLVYRFKRVQVTDFQKGFKRWVKSRKMPKEITAIGFNPELGFFLKLIRRDEDEEDMGDAASTDREES